MPSETTAFLRRDESSNLSRWNYFSINSYMPKRKKFAPAKIEEITDRAAEYLQLWKDLQASHEEIEFDCLRREMNALWKKMDASDKRDFRRESDAIERREPHRKPV
jgi:hypothetical protein